MDLLCQYELIIVGLAFVAVVASLLPWFGRHVAAWAALLTVPLAVLVLFDQLLSHFFDRRPPLWLGVVLVVLIVGGAAWAWGRFGLESGHAPLIAAIYALVLAVVLAPAIAGARWVSAEIRGHEHHAPPPKKDEPAFPSEVDVLIVVPDREPAAPPLGRPAQLPLWDIHYSVGFAGPRGVRWVLAAGNAEQARDRLVHGGQAVSPPAPRPEADKLVVLNPDALPPVTPVPAKLEDLPETPGERDEWRAVLRAPPLAGLPAVAILQTTNRARLADWRASGLSAVSWQSLNVERLPDAAVLLAIRRPDADQELAIAYQHRPLVFFDSSEKEAALVDVDAFMATRRVTLCNPKCQTIGSARELTGGRDAVLHIEPVRAATVPSRRRGLASPLAPPSKELANAYYVNVVPHEGRTYLDYLVAPSRSTAARWRPARSAGPGSRSSTSPASITSPTGRA